MESSDRELTEVEKRAILKGRNQIQTEQLYSAFKLFCGNGSNIALLMFRNDITENHLIFLHQQELDRYENEDLYRGNMYSRVWDELATHPKTPRTVLEELTNLNDEPTRRKARMRLRKINKSEQNAAGQPATRLQSKSK